MLVQRKKSEFPTLGDVFGNFLQPDWLNFPSNFKEVASTFPAVNVKETETDYQIEMAVPGKNKNDFDIAVNDKLLIISSKQQQSKEEKEDNYTRREFSYSSLRRTFKLPEIADENSCKATYLDGILKVIVPKKESKKAGVKSIEIL